MRLCYAGWGDQTGSEAQGLRNSWICLWLPGSTGWSSSAPHGDDSRQLQPNLDHDIFWWGFPHFYLYQVVFGGVFGMFLDLSQFRTIQSCKAGCPASSCWPMVACQVLLANCGCAMPTCLQPSALWRPSVWRCGGPAIPATPMIDQKMDEHGREKHVPCNFDEIWPFWEMRGVDLTAISAVFWGWLGWVAEERPGRTGEMSKISCF